MIKAPKKGGSMSAENLEQDFAQKQTGQSGRFVLYVQYKSARYVQYVHELSY